MENAACVSRIQRVCDLGGKTQEQAYVERACGQHLRQRLAFEQLHDDERATLMLVHFVDGADARVIERRRRARLAHEAVHRHRCRRRVDVQELQRDHPRERQVVRLVHDAHATGANELGDAIVMDGLTDHGGRERQA